MMTFRTRSPESCGIVALDQAEIVREFHEKVTHPPGNLANAAVYILEPEVLEYLRGLKKSFVDFSSEVIPHFLGRIYTFHNSDYHEDIGTLEHWRRAQNEYCGRPPSAPQNAAWDYVLKAHPELESAMGKLLSES
jgi:mannose-1-phosphate guanylyltransferase